MTPREYFASQAMSGFLQMLAVGAVANERIDEKFFPEGDLNYSGIARESVLCADALIEELAKNSKGIP